MIGRPPRDAAAPGPLLPAPLPLLLGLAVVLAVVVAAGLAAVLAHERSRLAADWHSLIARAEADGLRLRGRPASELRWPGFVLVVRDVRLSAPVVTGVSVRTDELTLAHPPFGRAGLGVRLDHPATATGGPFREELDGRAVVLGVSPPGGATLAGDRLDIRPPGAAGGITLFAPRAAGTASGAGVRVTLAAGRLLLGAAGLLAAGLPEAERTFGAISLDATLDGTACAPAASITRARADWLGVALQVSGRLTVTAGRIAGTLSVTPGTGWRGALARAAHDGAITSAQARAATGLLALLGKGASPVLPLAVDGGRVTLAGLLLIRLPDLPQPAGCPRRPDERAVPTNAPSRRTRPVPTNAPP